MSALLDGGEEGDELARCKKALVYIGCRRTLFCLGAESQSNGSSEQQPTLKYLLEQTIAGVPRLIKPRSCSKSHMLIVHQAENSNGLFGPVGRVLGVSTNSLAPAILSLTAAPVDTRTNATQLSLSMDAPGVPCRVWYTVLPLRDTVLLAVEEFSAEEIKQTAPPSNVVDLPKVSVRSLCGRRP